LDYDIYPTSMPQAVKLSLIENAYSRPIFRLAILTLKNVRLI